MKKLSKKNHSQKYTIEAYFDCTPYCACYCAVCHCWQDILWISDNSSSSGAMNYIPNATAQVQH